MVEKYISFTSKAFLFDDYLKENIAIGQIKMIL